MSDVENINSNNSAVMGGNYALANSINASSVAGWTPIGVNASGTVLNSGNGFTGVFEGLGNTISNLNVSTSTQYSGLFGYEGGTLRDVGLTGGAVTGSNFAYVGALAGYESAGTITAAFSGSSVSNGKYEGGLVGQRLRFGDHVVLFDRGCHQQHQWWNLRWWTGRTK